MISIIFLVSNLEQEDVSHRQRYNWPSSQQWASRCLLIRAAFSVDFFLFFFWFGEFELRFTGFYRLPTLIFIHCRARKCWGSIQAIETTSPPPAPNKYAPPCLLQTSISLLRSSVRHLEIMYGAWSEKEEHVQLCECSHIHIYGYTPHPIPPSHHFAAGSNVRGPQSPKCGDPKRI